ncbi:GNAT family N-acetyltransferase [Noviherbaspirillum sp.]|uniref:GNAT family N-acetyltransferase n=1 Tax=Noviherbaspirillum sp. TaxID=1926288 RepID=UPI002FE27EBE
MSNPALRNNQDKHRYELIDDDQVLGYAEYNMMGDAVMFTHTEIASEHEGKGYGSQLAQKALDDVRSQHKQVMPVCQFITAYIRRHPDYIDLVTPDSRRAFKI